MSDLSVYSPMDGVLVPLSQVPDPVFSQSMLGDGVAIDSAQGIIKAPFSGKISSFHPMCHAFVLTHQNIELLVHIGLETIRLNREGFAPLVEEGAEVSKGQPILKFSPELVAQKAACPYILLVITAPTKAQVIQKISGSVKTGQPLFTVHIPAENPLLMGTTEYVECPPVTIGFPQGLHARPAGILVQQAAQFACPIQLVNKQKTANAKSVLEIMQLGIKQKDRVTIRVFSSKKTAKQVFTVLTPFLQGKIKGF